jgi:hypothetical protein
MSEYAYFLKTKRCIQSHPTNAPAGHPDEFGSRLCGRPADRFYFDLKAETYRCYCNKCAWWTDQGRNVLTEEEFDVAMIMMD